MTRATHLARITAAQSSYLPNKSISNQMRQTIFVPLIGPFAVGKTSTIIACQSADKDFGRVRSFTTRPMRDDETSADFVFLNNNLDTWRELWRKITNGDFVQFTIHPTTGYIYGSDIDTYRQKYSLLAMMPEAIPQRILALFKDIRPVALVTEPNEWQRRVRDVRAIIGPDDYNKRLREGINNLRWCIEHASELLWVNNGRQSLKVTAEHVRNVVKNNGQSDPQGPLIAKQLLEFFKQSSDNRLSD